MKRVLRLLSWLFLGGAFLTAVRAQPFPFEVRVVSSSNPALVVTAAGGQFGQLAEPILRSSGAFQPFANQPLTASFRYYGANEAIVFTRDAAATQLTIGVPATGYSRTFTGANATQLEANLENFFRGP